MLFQREHGVRVFPVVVERFVSPRIVERAGRFDQILLRHEVGDLVVTHGAIIAHAVADAGIDQATGLIFPDQIGKFPALLGADGTRRVKPDQAQISVSGEQFRHLRLDLRLEAFFTGSPSFA